MTETKFKPIGDRVLVEPAPEHNKTKNLIVIPDAAKQKSNEAIIVALGTGRIGKDGNLVPFPVQLGDRVLVTQYAGTVIKGDGKEYKLVNTDELIAIIG